MGMMGVTVVLSFGMYKQLSRKKIHTDLDRPDSGKAKRSSMNLSDGRSCWKSKGSWAIRMLRSEETTQQYAEETVSFAQL